MSNVPGLEFRKGDGGTGVVRPAPTGILAIIAPGEKGTVNRAETHTKKDALKTANGWGHLTEFGTLTMAWTKKPVVTVLGDASTDGDYSAFATSGVGGGTATFTEGATKPLDELSIVVEFPTGGTVGAAGIKYRYSINGGETFSKILALGTADSIEIPDTGASIELGEGTIIAGARVAFTTTGPKLTNTDLPAALEALRVTKSPFEAVLIDVDADLTTVGTVNAWLSELNKAGKFPTVVLTARPKAADEDETEYQTALAAIVDAASSLDIVMCADLGDVPSELRGIMMPRPAGLFAAAWGMSVRVGTDPAYVELGPLPNVKITDARNNPKYHNEELFPTLDGLRLTTLRTIEGYEGVYITNANLLSPSGSDYVYWQHARCINRGMAITYQILTKKLSKGVRKAPKPGPNGERFIAEGEAADLESLVNAQLYAELVKPGEVDDMKLLISRDDDIRSNAGATITCSLQSVSLGYVKKFVITAGYVTQIANTNNAGQ